MAACLALAGAASGVPANDSFSSAQPLSGTTGTIDGSNVDATRETGEPVPDPNASGKTVWFTWQAPFSGPASIDTRGSSFDTYVAVYTGTRVDHLTWVAGNDIDFWVGSARAQFTAVAGTVYRVQVDGMRGESGAISLTWNRPRPANDDFAAAQAIAGESGSVDGTNLLATAEPGEPSSYGQGHSIWYRWTAPSTALYELEATAAMPVYLVAYTGSSLTSLVQQAVNADSSNPRVRLAATAGTTYVLELDSASFQNTGPVRIAWRRLAAPSNDAFAAAQRLDARPSTVAGDAWGATAEPGEPAHAGRPPHASVWYRWRAPASTEVGLAVDGNQFNCGTAVYTGTALTALTPIASYANYSDCDLSFDAVAGTDYAIAVNAETDTGGPFTLRLVYAPPPNDAFAAAESIYATTIPFQGRNALATKEPGEPEHGPRPGGASVWYAWSSGTPGTVTVDTVGSTLDTLLAAYTGASVSSLVRLASDDDSAGAGASRISFHVDGSSAYRIAVDGALGAVGDVRLNASFRADPPANDAFAAAQRISTVKNFTIGRTTGATKEAGEPAHAGDAGGHSVWYRWTAPADGLAVFDTYDVEPPEDFFHDTTFDTLLAVYRGSSLASLTPVAANDDHAFGWYSRVSFLVAAGEEYAIAVDGDDGAQGFFALNWTVAPQNDDFDRPQILTGTEGTVTGTALRSTWEALDGGDPSERDEPANVWFLWRAPTSGPVELLLEGSSTYTDLAVYTGPNYATLEGIDVVGTRTGRFLSVKLQARAGTVYRIEVVGDSFGAFTLAWHPTTIPPPPVVPPPPNDDFADAQSIAGESGTVAGSNERATNEPGEPVHSDDDQGDYSVWYRWTAPYSGTAELDTVGSDFTTVLAVYTGTAVDRLSRVTYGFGTEKTRVGVNAGTTYSIAVSGAWRYDPLGNLVLNWRRAAGAPANDGFAAATPLSGGSGSLELSNAGASAEAFEPRHAGLRPAASVWFRWTAPATGQVSFQTSISSAEGRLAAYTGSGLGSLVRVASNNESQAGGAEARILFGAQAGVTYAIAFDTNWTPGTASLSWRMPPSPPNDAWTDAAPLPRSQYYVNRYLVTDADNFGATTETGEPAHGGVSGAAATVWYRLPWEYLAQTVTLDSVGSTFDTVLAVYTGSSLSALTPVASDDDSAGGGLSRLTFTTASGLSGSPTTYWIAVAGKGGATGKITLTLSPADAPPNDHFHAATWLVGPSGSITGSVYRASLQLGEPSPTGFDLDGSIWYRWTAPATGTWMFDPAGTEFDVSYGVYLGETVDQLVEVAAGDERPLFVPVVAGATYSIMLNGCSCDDGVARLTWRPAVVGANDRFAAAQTLSGPGGSVTASNREASVELGEPWHAGSFGGASLWYRWTAPFTGTVAIDTAGSSPSDLVVAVYTGTSLLDLQDIAENDDFGGDLVASVRFAVLAGTTYWIAVDGSTFVPEFVPRGDVTLNWVLAVPPPNDRFAAATSLTGESGSASGTTVGARSEPGEPPHGDAAAGATVWYSWTAPSGGNYRFDASGSGFPALLGLYSGTALESLRVVRRSDDLGGRLTAVTFAATAGTTYRLAVDGQVRATGPVSLTWSRIGPANDAFAAAQPIAGREDTVLAATRGATAEAGEPAHAGSPAAASVWYRWRAPATEVVTFDTHGSDYDTRVAVYTGAAVTSLSPVGMRDGSLPTDAVRVEAVEDTTYWIAVDGAAGATGNTVVNWSPTPVPANDHLAAARFVAGREGSLPQTSFPATHESGEPDHAGVSGRRSVWYRFKAPAPGTLTISALYPEFDTAIAAYRGTTVGGLTLVAQDSGGAGLYGEYRQSTITFAVAAGQEYRVAVDGVAGQAGSFVLVWRLPPQNDDLANAQPIAGESGSVEGTTLGAGKEAGEPETGFVQDQTVWYRWTAPVSGTYLFDLARSEAADVGLTIFSGDTFATLKAAGHWRDTGRAGVVAGTTYLVRAAAARPAGPIRLNWRRMTDAPANDNVAAARVLSGPEGVASGTNVGSSREPGEPSHGEQGYTVWFAWTAPAPGKLHLWTNGSSYDAKVVVYTGSAIDALVKVDGTYSTTGGTPSTSNATVSVVPGTTYRIALDGASQGSYLLAWLFDGSSPDSGTSNDAFAAAHVLSGAVGNASGSNVGATKEPGEPSHAGNAGGRSVWYSWRAPASGSTLVETTSCGFDSLLAVYTGSSVGALTAVASNDNVTPSCPASRVTFNAVAGTTYRIAVDGKNGAADSFSLGWSGQPGDVEAPQTMLLSGPAGIVAARDATFTFSASEPASFECRLDAAAFASCVSPASYAGLAPGTYTFQVRARDAAGNVDATPEQRTWTIAPAPANDAFVAAQPVSGLVGDVTGALFGATVEADEPSHADRVGDRSVWYRWTAPRDGVATVELGATSLLEVAVGVYTGSSLATLAAVGRIVAPSSAPATDSATFRAVAGTTYTIAVAASFNAEFRLQWRLAPPNDARRDAIVLVGPTGTWRGDNVAATLDPLEPRHGGDVGGRSIWFRWTAPATGRLTLDTVGSDAALDTLLAVYGEGPYGFWWDAALTAGDDDSAGSGKSRVSFEVFTGTVYEIAVDGFAGASGSIALNWTFAAGTAPTPTPPTVALTEPADGSLVRGDVALAATATDPDGIERVEFVVNGSVVGTDTVAPYAVDWDSTTVVDGPATIVARATDFSSAQATSPARTVRVDNHAPDTAIDGGPTGTTTSTAATFSFSASEPGASFRCRLDAEAPTVCSSPAAYASLVVGDHRFEVAAVDAAGNVDATPAVRTWTLVAGDTTPPETTIDSGPSGTTASTSAILMFSANEVASFSCRLDGSSWGTCTSPQGYGPLAAGGHTFEVRATDAAGNVDPTPAARSWTIEGTDTTPPETTIGSGPPASSSATSGTFAFASSEPGSSFLCSLDDASPSACVSPMAYTGLAPGQHRFRVHATDAAGNADPTPAAWSWTVEPPADATAPDTTIDSGPSGTTTLTSATFTFSADEAGASFDCALDGGSWTGCTSPNALDGFAAGAHTFAVRAIDVAGNVDATPAVREWTVEPPAPSASPTPPALPPAGGGGGGGGAAPGQPADDTTTITTIEGSPQPVREPLDAAPALRTVVSPRVTRRGRIATVAVRFSVSERARLRATIAAVGSSRSLILLPGTLLAATRTTTGRTMATATVARAGAYLFRARLASKRLVKGGAYLIRLVAVDGAGQPTPLTIRVRA